MDKLQHFRLLIIISGQRILISGDIAEDFSSGKLSATLDCFCGQPIGMLLNSMREIPTSGPPGVVLGGVWENPDVIMPLKKPLLKRESGPHPTQFLGSTQVHIPNGIHTNYNNESMQIVTYFC